MKVVITDERAVCRTIQQIVNHGGKAVVQRKGDGIIIMEEHRQIRYRSEGDDEQ